MATLGAVTTRFGVLKASSDVLAPDTASSPVPAAPATTVAFAPNYATDLLHLRRWQKSDLILYVEEPGKVNDARDHDHLAAMRKGAAIWNPYTNGILNVRFTENPAEADIRVTFVDKGSLPGGAIGRTEVTYRNRDNVIVSATVRVDRTLKSDLLAQVAAHEFGHAFGMEGHSVNRTDLMYARAHLPAAVTDRDANTLHLNYSLEAIRADAKPAAQPTQTGIVRAGHGYTTAAACSLPGED